jgi:hypothetical protein
MVNRPDYSDLAKIKTEKQKKRESQEKTISEDINKIEDALSSVEENELKEVHIYLDGKYGACITNWGKSMYGYNAEYGFNYNYLGQDSLVHNLKLMKGKLEGYLCGFSQIASLSGPSNNISVNVSNTNEIAIDVSFEQARQKIEDMPGLTDADTEEIKGKINDLENIANEDIPKKKKWEKIKPILKFAIDKGADVAITIMGLILQMKLGV